MYVLLSLFLFMSTPAPGRGCLYLFVYTPAPGGSALRTVLIFSSPHQLLVELFLTFHFWEWPPLSFHLHSSYWLNCFIMIFPSSHQLLVGLSLFFHLHTTLGRTMSLSFHHPHQPLAGQRLYHFISTLAPCDLGLSLFFISTLVHGGVVFAFWSPRHQRKEAPWSSLAFVPHLLFKVLSQWK